MKYVLIVALLIGSFGCATDIPKNLTPTSVAAYQATKVVLALDVIRNAAIALADASVITRDESVKVVEFHKAAVTTIHATPGGWKVTVLAGLDSTKKTLSVTAQNQLGHYFDLAKTLIDEVTN